MSKVLVPLARGFEEIEAISIIDVLRRAGIEVLVAALDSNMLVNGKNNIKVQANIQITQIISKELDMIVLPGGWDGTYLLAEDKHVQQILKEMDKNKQNIAAICAAPFALNKAGVLKDKYTCYPTVENDIAKDGYQGDANMVVEDQNIMTSRGPATAICFALKIVKKLKGNSTYLELKAGLLADYCD